MSIVHISKVSCSCHYLVISYQPKEKTILHHPIGIFLIFSSKSSLEHGEGKISALSQLARLHWLDLERRLRLIRLCVRELADGGSPPEGDFSEL